MALFGTQRESHPVQRLEKLLKDKRGQRESIAARLTVTEALIVEKRAAVQQLALNGAADGDLDQAEGNVRAAEDRGETLRGALGQIDDAITQAERELSEAIEQRDRDEVARALDEMAKAIGQAHPKYSEATQKLLQAISESNVSIPETVGLVKFLQGTQLEIISAVAIIESELRTRAKGVRAGTAKFTKHLSAQDENAESVTSNA